MRARTNKRAQLDAMIDTLFSSFGTTEVSDAVAHKVEQEQKKLEHVKKKKEKDVAILSWMEERLMKLAKSARGARERLESTTLGQPLEDALEDVDILYGEFHYVSEELDWKRFLSESENEQLFKRRTLLGCWSCSMMCREHPDRPLYGILSKNPEVSDQVQELRGRDTIIDYRQPDTIPNDEYMPFLIA